MKLFQTKSSKLSGTTYSEIISQAREILRYHERKTKRQSYIRSMYFDKQKIFFTYFMDHIISKRPPDRVRRLKLLSCAIELIQTSNIKPESYKISKGEIVYRFLGITKDKITFVVQIKEDLKRKRKYLMSVFPIDNK